MLKSLLIFKFNYNSFKALSTCILYNLHTVQKLSWHHPSTRCASGEDLNVFTLRWLRTIYIWLKTTVTITNNNNHNSQDVHVSFFSPMNLNAYYL